MGVDRLARIVASLVLWGAVQAAFAQVLSGSATPRPDTVDLGQTSQVRIDWNLNLTTGTATSVSSPALVLGIDDGTGCQPLLTQPLPLSRSLTGPVTQVTLSETLSVPANVALAARQRGASSLLACRDFDDGSGSPVTVTATLGLQSGGLGGAFGIGYVRMRFDDGALSRLVARGAGLSARAHVRYQGRGLLRARWEIATPGSTRGEARFRPLGMVHRYLTGDGDARLESPPLPTGQAGLYLLRLRLLEPDIEAPDLVLRYFVQGAETAPEVAALALRAPAAGARLAPDTAFAWQKVADASAYRLEFVRDAPDGQAPARAALLLEGTRSDTRLTPLVRRRLSPGGWWWQVVALGAEGQVLARSPLRRLWVGRDGP